MSGEAEPSWIAETNAALAEWQQGDAVVNQIFVHVADLSRPLTDVARDLAQQAAADGEEPGVATAEAAVPGLVVVSQTCDIVRDCLERPYLDVAPLHHLRENEAHELENIRRGRRPRFAYIPGLADRRLVADLDRTMTVEKTVAAAWSRIRGCRTDEEARAFAEALARKRARFAFPDDFNLGVQALRERIVKKHDKASDEGRALHALREIRVRAAPSWSAEDVALTFWFILDENAQAETRSLVAATLIGWKALLALPARYKGVDALVATLEDLTAKDYEASDRLDLDHLSTTPRQAPA